MSGFHARSKVDNGDQIAAPVLHNLRTAMRKVAQTFRNPDDVVLRGLSVPGRMFAPKNTRHGLPLNACLFASHAQRRNHRSFCSGRCHGEVKVEKELPRYPGSASPTLPAAHRQTFHIIKTSAALLRLYGIPISLIRSLFQKFGKRRAHEGPSIRCVRANPVRRVLIQMAIRSAQHEMQLP